MKFEIAKTLSNAPVGDSRTSRRVEPFVPWYSTASARIRPSLRTSNAQIAALLNDVRSVVAKVVAKFTSTQPFDCNMVKPAPLESNSRPSGIGKGVDQLNDTSGTNNGSTADCSSLSSILIHDPGVRPNVEFVSTRLKSLNPSTSPLSMSGTST